MQKYECHTVVEVEAAKIVERKGGRLIRLEGDVNFINPTQEWRERFTPVGHPGEPVDFGYYLRRANGDLDWMSTEAFEALFALPQPELPEGVDTVVGSDGTVTGAPIPDLSGLRPVEGAETGGGTEAPADPAEAVELPVDPASALDPADDDPDPGEPPVF